ncbi:hypothetical protein SLS60_011241 [Paraconiothyrium brasiliense]|uniref:Uncharacterized protein n=1 Tax=Paraconiothyrium brasiliense TaxID=300254 RepID=A0ABR3QKZ6_9PLEO
MGHLVVKLLGSGDAHERFMQKTAQYDASLDHEDGGGVGIENHLEEEHDEAKAISHPAIQPEYDQDAVSQNGDWPTLTQGRNASGASTLAPSMDQMSLAGSESDTIVGSSSNTVDESAVPSQGSKQYVQLRSVTVFGLSLGASLQSLEL